MKIISPFVLLAIALISSCKASLPKQTVYDSIKNKDENIFHNILTLKKQTSLFVTILCDSLTGNVTELSIRYELLEHTCKKPDNITTPLNNPLAERTELHLCGHGGHIVLNGIAFREDRADKPRNQTLAKDKPRDTSLLTIPKDGIYEFSLSINPVNPDRNFNASLNIKFLGQHGFLAAEDIPLLHFYGFMCIYYFILAMAWSVLSAFQFRDLLRIQFWVGSVILLGMMEKASFYFLYSQANEYGASSVSLALSAELISCIKRALARILVLIVAMGYGIIKARLGDETGVRLSVVSFLYFSMAAIEGYLRVSQTADSDNRQFILAAVPLALIDSLICWWIFTSLVQTMRTLRLRRNHIKLQFYNHFKNTLIFGVLMSVIFMLYSLRIRHYTECVWKSLFIDDAYWHVLFSILLTVIAFLWRPTRNNHRYAFLPLLENDDDDDDDGEEVHFSASRYGNGDVNIRSNKINQHNKKSESEVEDETIKWVEENIANASILLDSDEELISTKFEMSKMN